MNSSQFSAFQFL